MAVNEKYKRQKPKTGMNFYLESGLPLKQVNDILGPFKKKIWSTLSGIQHALHAYTLNIVLLENTKLFAILDDTD